MVSPTEDAILELSGALAQIDNYYDLPRVLQKILKKYIHFEWMGIFTWGKDFDWNQPSGVVNISTNPHLPFNWHDLYQEIAPVDSYAQKVMALPPGQAVIFEELRPFSESDRWVREFCKKYSDTAHYMGMPTENGPDGRSAIGIYRTDPKNAYTQSEKQLFMTLAPILRSAIKTMLLHQRWDMVRIGHEKIFQTEEIQPLVVDLQLNIVSFPSTTQDFLRKAFNAALQDGLPEFVRTWILKGILPQYQLSHTMGPWQLTERTVSGDIICRAYLFLHDHSRPILVIIFRQHETTMDFRILSRLGITQREVEVLAYLPLGYTNQQISAAMEISVSGVKKHLRNLCRKLETASRSETLFRAMSLKRELEQQAYGCEK